MRKRVRLGNKNIMVFLCMFLCMGAAFCITGFSIGRQAEESCFRRLRETTAQYAREIRENAEQDTELLRALARMAAGFERLDCEGMERLLTSVSGGGMFSELSLLFPDGRIFLADGSWDTAPEELDFAVEAAGGEHICRGEAGGEGAHEGRLYNIVPVYRDGETAALLCGTVDLAGQKEKYREVLGGESYRLCLIEGKSGDILIDTMSGENRNTQELADRRMKKGCSPEKVKTDIAAGRGGKTASYSETAGEYLYCVYEQVGVNDWVLLFSLPESDALRDARSARLTLYLLAVMEGVILAAYFAWILLGAKREMREKEAQLDRVRYMLDIEEILFDAPRRPELFRDALSRIGELLDAEKVFLVDSKNPEAERRFTSGGSECGLLQRALEEEFPCMHAGLCREGSILSYDVSELRGVCGDEYGKLERLGIRSMMVIEVKNMEGVHIGALGALNLRRRFKSAELLECVMLSFSMAISNMESFLQISEMGAKDQLTGLNNRNSYRRAMERWEKSGDASLSCIYVDADGLHEINNSYGHVAGDRLLQCVAGALSDEFEAGDVFRVGGDEFIVFASGLSDEQLSRKARAVARTVSDSGYHVSVGTERRSRVPLVFEMVKSAEEKMYEAKRAYYENREEGQQTREMNRQLEETLTEKRDLDVFRAVIASKYTGVYIVDLSLDSMRPIYIPSYFARIVEEAGGKFSAAIKKYAQENVMPEQRGAFLQTTDYARVEESLRRGEEPSLRYRRRDGRWLYLKIYRSPDYTELWKECIWSFEAVDGTPEE